MNLYEQFYIYTGYDEREKKYAKDRFLTIFRSMKEPQWQSKIEVIENTGKIELKNKGGVIQYNFLGDIKAVEEIKKIMNDEIFNDWKFES